MNNKKTKWLKREVMAILNNAQLDDTTRAKLIRKILPAHQYRQMADDYLRVKTDGR